VPGKPYQSRLLPYQDEVFALLDKGLSYRQVAETLNRTHPLGVTHNAVFSFVKSRRPERRRAGLFFEGLSRDIRDALVKQVTAVWTHESTAIEGNTLTLGETVKVLELGLTINGKPHPALGVPECRRANQTRGAAPAAAFRHPFVRGSHP
jgi:hypothetical protein